MRSNAALPTSPKIFDALPIFANLTPDERTALARVTRIFNLPGHSVVQDQNVVPSSLIGLLEGAIELRTTEPNGGTSTSSIVAPGQVIDLLAVMSASETLSEAVTTIPVRAAIMPATAIRELAATNHLFCQDVLANVAQYSRSLLRKLNGQKMRDGNQRLSLWLLENATPDGKVVIPHSKRTLASILGTT